MTSGMLVINKIDLAPYVGADAYSDGSRCKTHARRRALRFHQSSKTGFRVDALIEWIRHSLLFEQ